MFEDFDFSPGKVVYNDFLIDPHQPLSRQCEALKEDLLQVNFGENYILDVGWYPSFATTGEFQIRVIKDGDWTSPVEVKRCTDLHELAGGMKECIRQIPLAHAV